MHINLRYNKDDEGADFIPVRKKMRLVKRTSAKKRNGRTFMFAMLALLVFTLIYHFGSDVLFNSSTYVVLADDEILVSFIDVGQGDATLIRTNHHTVLIDGGDFSARHALLNYLQDAGIARLDYVVATHPHADHIGGLISVLERFNVGTVVMPDAVNDTLVFENFIDVIDAREIPVIMPKPGDILNAGLINLTVLAPEPGEILNVNNASIVLHMQHRQNAFLFTGDAEIESERAMLISGRNLKAHVLHVGHHGSRTSTSYEFLQAVNPSVAVISVGSNNQFGHPHHEVIQRLESKNIQIHRTDRAGTIRMVTNGYQIYLI